MMTMRNALEAFRIVIIPPPQMVVNMRIGAMQAYMVAEPWNTRAITGNEGVGFTLAQGRELWAGHPDRVLAVRESFINDYPKTYRSLVKAMIEACQYCDRRENREEVAKIITGRSFTGARPRSCKVPSQIDASNIATLSPCTTKFTAPGIVGDYNYGGFDNQSRIQQSPYTTVFYDLPLDMSHPLHDHSTFLWQSQSLWLMTQAARWGQVREFPKDAERISRLAWRTDLYRDIAGEMGIRCPAEDFKVEPASVFVDRRPFNPGDPVGYLRDFEIRADSPIRIYLSN
jgi:nitrate/nitrite transport system substrate-binding protein